MLIILDVVSELIIKVMDEYTWMDDVCIGKSERVWLMCVFLVYVYIFVMSFGLTICILCYHSGSVKISLMDVVNSSGPVEEDYQLDVKNQEAFCACRLEWSSAAM